MKKKMMRLTALLLVIAMAVGVFATATTAANLNAAEYYSSNIKPAMDDIGNNMRSVFTSRSAMQGAFYKAQNGISKLKSANNAVPQLKSDKKLKKYLKNMQKYINLGQKRSKKVGSKDKTIMSYQKKIAKNLKSYMTRVQKKLGLA